MCFFLMVKRFGMNPLGFHICALILHALNSLLVMYIAYTIVNHGYLVWRLGLFVLMQ